MEVELNNPPHQKSCVGWLTTRVLRILSRARKIEDTDVDGDKVA